MIKKRNQESNNKISVFPTLLHHQTYYFRTLFGLALNSFKDFRTLGVKLTGGATHDCLFDHVTARHSLLKALGPLLQKPLSCYHLQLPANTSAFYLDYNVSTFIKCLKKIHPNSIHQEPVSYFVMTGFWQAS